MLTIVDFTGGVLTFTIDAAVTNASLNGSTLALATTWVRVPPLRKPETRRTCCDEL